ncbi:hypothetical protein [Streptomyces albiaxialis]|uniref:hypothetical protein n=1 Tax=Streptomyces albiaxialis TaxID=329523 RepID=UPI0031DBB9F1
MGAQAAPGGLQDVEDLVLGDGLVDATVEDLLGASAVELDGLVRGEEGHADAFQRALHGQTLVHTARDAAGCLADHHVEAAVGALGLGQEIVDAAVARNGDAEPVLGVGPVTALVEFEAARFHVVEVADDGPRGGDGGLRPFELPQQGLARVLPVLGRRPPGERDADLTAQESRGHGERGHRQVGHARRLLRVTHGEAEGRWVVG